MATFKKTLSGDSRYKVELTVNEITPPTSTDIANNSTRVTYSLNLTRNYSTGGYYTSSKTNPIKITINGKVLVNKKIAYDFRGETSIPVASGTATIPHETDGTKTIVCSGYFKDNENSLGSATASGNLKLTDLHKSPEISNVIVSETNQNLIDVGIEDETFVSYLSQKSINFDIFKYDDVRTIENSANNGSLTATGNLPLILDFTNNQVILTDNKVRLNLTTTDSLNSVGNLSVDYDNYIAYRIPSVVDTSFKARRKGQLSGLVNLKANGTFYNGDVGSETISPVVKYRYALQNSEEWSEWITATITTTDNTWQLDNDIGSTNPDDVDHYFNPDNSYDVQIYVYDQFRSSQVYTQQILLGKPTWTEYKDRVDFEKLTIKNIDILGELFYKSGDVIDIGQASGREYVAYDGYITSSTTLINIPITTPKRLDNITSATVEIFEVEARGGNGYLNSESGYHEFVGRSGYTVNAYINSPNMILLTVAKSSAWSNVSNNTLIEANGRIKITLN